MHRRQFAQGLCAASVCAASISSRRLLAIDPFERPTPGKIKLSLAAYSMRRYLAPKDDEPHKMDLFDFVDFCHEQGLPGAELTSYYFPEEVTSEYLLDLKRHCHLRGISISGGAIRNDYCSTDAEAVKKDIDHTRTWVDHYAKLGAPAIRIFAGKENKSESLSTTLKRCAKNCEIACKYAAKKGVMLALENHGGVTAKAEGLLEIVKAVDSPAFGVNFDSGNFRMTSDPYEELAQIAPYAVNAQIKVAIHPNGGTEETDLARVIQILKDAGYSGWVALEYEEKADPLTEIPKWLDRLKELT